MLLYCITVCLQVYLTGVVSLRPFFVNEHTPFCSRLTLMIAIRRDSSRRIKLFDNFSIENLVVCKLRAALLEFKSAVQAVFEISRPLGFPSSCSRQFHGALCKRLEFNIVIVIRVKSKHFFIDFLLQFENFACDFCHNSKYELCQYFC